MALFPPNPLLLLLLCLSAHTLCVCAKRDMRLQVQRNDDLEPALGHFPDPSIIQGKDGLWYAFATAHKDVEVQVARAEHPLGTWEKLDMDALEDKAWTSGRHTWAPDVRELDDGSYILYFSGQVRKSLTHCIGVARSANVTGPYKPDPEPWVCPKEDGGAIDASGFVDEATGFRYVVYKVDGNAKGPWTKCGSGSKSAKASKEALRTPLMLQRVQPDGATKIGEPLELLDREPELDGPLVEAPSMVRRSRWGGSGAGGEEEQGEEDEEESVYLLFYSSHCFSDPKYDVKYAWASRVEGPYTRADEPFLKAADLGLRAPGGATVGAELPRGEGGGDGKGDVLVFHGDCEEGRCMYVVPYDEA